MSASAISGNNTASMLAALALQERLDRTADLNGNRLELQKSRQDANARLKQLEETRHEMLHKAVEEAERDRKVVYSVSGGFGRISVYNDGTMDGQGLGASIVMATLDDLAKLNGFKEPRNRLETVFQRVAVLEMYFAPKKEEPDHEDALEIMKKAFDLLAKVLEKLKEGLKSGELPYPVLKLSDSTDTVSIMSSDLRILAGDGDDRIFSWANNIVEGGAGDDTIVTWSENSVDGGDGADRIATWSEGQVIAGNGNDTVWVWSGSTVDGGAGNDAIKAWSNSHVEGGSGDDVIYVSSDSTVTGGDGNDMIDVQSGSRADGGEGDDVIEGSPSSVLEGGAGNDWIRADANSIGRGGDGNDGVYGAGELYGDAGNDVVAGNGRLSGGTGDDIVRGAGELSGDDGNDVIVAYDFPHVPFTQVSGGRGDDQLFIDGSVAVSFGRGDGQDTVVAWDYAPSIAAGVQKQQDRTALRADLAQAVTFQFGDGISSRNMTVTIDAANLELDFGAGDSITILDYRNVSATLKFSDGKTMQLSDFIDASNPAAAPAVSIPIVAAASGILMDVQA